jgi:hypothetical protein
MAVYKVLQDIEGEDKLIAWLTPKQTIYAAITVVSIVLAFVLGRVNIALSIPWLIPIVFFGFLAAPLGRDQPNDIWLAAQLRFYVKNRKRIWDQSGMQELVHITVPKRIEKIYTDGLRQEEVRSRLKALSSTIDSRGWAVKNVNVNLTASPQFTNQFTQSSDDRLVGTESVAQDVPISDVTAADDIMDAENNSVAQRFDEQIKRQEVEHLEKLRKNALNPTASSRPRGDELPADYYFMHEQQAPQLPPQPVNAPPLATFSSQVVAPGSVMANTTSQATAPVPDEEAEALLKKIHHDQELAHEMVEHGHEKVIKTSAERALEEREEALRRAEEKRLAIEAEKRAAEEARRRRIQETRRAPDATIRRLSQDSGLKVSTLAVQAKHEADKQANDDEVVISLH